MLDLIFVHVSKTGGTSVMLAMLEHFGAEAVALDYEDRPLHPLSDARLDPVGYLARWHGSGYPHVEGKRAVVGHLWLRKYDPVEARIRATVLRHPISRALSHYHFWLASGSEHPVVSLVRRHNLSFLEFAQLPFIRHFYTEGIFRDVDMNAFDYVGDHATLRTDWPTVMQRLGLSSPPIAANKTADLSAGYAERLAEVQDDPVQMAKLRDIFADELRFYERWAAR